MVKKINSITSLNLKSFLHNFATITFILFIIYICVYKSLIILTPVPESILSKHPPFQPHAFTRLLFGFGLSVFWIGLFAFIQNISKKLKYPHALLSLTATIGWGMILLFAFANTVRANHFLTVILTSLPTFLWIIWLSYKAKDFHFDFKWNRTFQSIVVLLAFSLLAYKIIDTFLWSVFFKSKADCDELYIWWSNTNELFKYGISNFLDGTLKIRNYLSGYSLITTTLLAPIPTRFFDYVMPVVPFLFGMAMTSMVFYRKARETLDTRTLLTTIGAILLLFFSHGWMYGLSFKVWYGESMAIMATAILFICMEEIADNRLSFSNNKTLQALFYMGIGATVSMTKPPLSLLFLVAILPTYVGFFLIFRISKIKNWILPAIYLVLGGIIVRVVWEHLLKKHNLGSVYTITELTFTSFKTEIFTKGILPLLLKDYKQIWVSYILAIIIALATSPKKSFAPICASMGMNISIIILYCTYWQTTEQDSAMRYLMHGCYGFVIFIFATRHLFPAKINPNEFNRR